MIKDSYNFTLIRGLNDQRMVFEMIPENTGLLITSQTSWLLVGVHRWGSTRAVYGELRLFDRSIWTRGGLKECCHFRWQYHACSCLQTRHYHPSQSLSPTKASFPTRQMVITTFSNFQNTPINTLKSHFYPRYQHYLLLCFRFSLFSQIKPSTFSKKIQRRSWTMNVNVKSLTHLL